MLSFLRDYAIERLVDKRSLFALLAIAVLAASTLLHDPHYPPFLDNWGFKYSDIVYGVFNTIFEKPDRWYSAGEYSQFVASFMEGDFRCPVPYLDYKFEYPTVIGLFWYASTCIGLTTAKHLKQEVGVYREVLSSAARIHYYVQVAFIACFYAITIYYLIKLGATRRRVTLFVVLPSTLIYLTYNWDVIAAGYALAGLYLYTRRRYFTSGLMMGLSIASKILTVGLATWLLIELLHRKVREGVLRYVLGLAVVLVPALGLLVLLAPRGFYAFIEHHAGWYCENCLYMLLVGDIHSELHRLAYVGTLALLWLFMVETRLKALESAEREYWILSLYTLVIFNYVFSPQMMLMLTPISILLLEKNLLYVYSVADVSNAMIILLFFKDDVVRKALGMAPRFSPWTMDSPVQWFASIRNVLLLFIVIYTGLRIVLEFTREQPTSSSVEPRHPEHT